MRYFLLDRITGFEKGSSASAIKNVTLTDETLHDHFPDHPTLPGALMIEAMAQLGGFLVEMSLNSRGHVRRALLAMVDKAKFHQMAGPGDQLVITANLGAVLEDAVRVSLRVECGERKIATAELTFSLINIDSEKIHEQRRYMYKLWTRNLDRAPEIL